MKLTQGRWRDVEPGNYVRDARGRTWHVMTWNHSTATIRDREGIQRTVTPSPYDAVEILTPTMNEAVSVVERMLGGTVIADERTGQ